jgi:hypothetical protein
MLRFALVSQIIASALVILAEQQPASCDWTVENSMAPSAVVFGATGAVGAELWRQLASSSSW